MFSVDRQIPTLESTVPPNGGPSGWIVLNPLNANDGFYVSPLGAVWSGSALFAQTCLSENFGTFR